MHQPKFAGYHARRGFLAVLRFLPSYLGAYVTFLACSVPPRGCPWKEMDFDPRSMDDINRSNLPECPLSEEYLRSHKEVRNRLAYLWPMTYSTTSPYIRPPGTSSTGRTLGQAQQSDQESAREGASTRRRRWSMLRKTHKNGPTLAKLTRNKISRVKHHMAKGAKFVVKKVIGVVSKLSALGAVRKELLKAVDIYFSDTEKKSEQIQAVFKEVVTKLVFSSTNRQKLLSKFPHLFLDDEHDLVDTVFEVARLALTWQDKNGNPLPQNTTTTETSATQILTMTEVLARISTPPWYGHCDIDTYTSGRLSKKMCLMAPLSRFIPRAINALLSYPLSKKAWWPKRADWAQQVGEHNTALLWLTSDCLREQTFSRQYKTPRKHSVTKLR